MARTWRLSGSPLLLIILLSAPFLALLATGQINGLRLFGGSVLSPFSSVAFDGTSSVNYLKAYNCNNGLASGWFGYGESAPSNYPCQQSSTPATNTLGSTTSSFKLPIANLGSDSNDNAYLKLAGANCLTANIAQTYCAHASVVLGGSSLQPPIVTGPATQSCAVSAPPCLWPCAYGPGIPPCTIGNSTSINTIGSSSTYQLSGGVSYPYNKVGSDQNFQATFSEPVPKCNPCTSPGPTTNSTNYWLEYGFAYRLQITGDSIVATYNCHANLLASNTDPQCVTAEVNALNQALAFINSNDAASGTVTIDLTVPLTLANNPSDKFGIIGAWIAQKGFLASSLTNGGSVSITPGTNHLLIPINNLPYSPFNYQDLSTWTNAQIPNALPTSISMPFKFSIQPKYTAQANGSNISILADYGITVDVPIVFLLVDQTTNPSGPPSGGGGGGTGGGGNPGGCGGLPSCPNYGNTTSNIQVHVTESLLGLPLSGVQVAAVSAQATACSASGGSTGTTDSNGNFLFQGLSTANGGNYLVCATGTSGTVTLIFISFQLTYGCNGASCTTQASISPGKSASVTIPLQTSFNSQLTTISFVLIGVGLLVLLVVVIVAPSSLFTLGFGSARALRAKRR